MGVNDIAFPHLGIYLRNLPKSFSVFGFEIAFYGLIIGIGVMLGVLMAVQMAKKEEMDTDIIWDFGIYAVIFSVIGARIYYVVFSWDLYKDNLLGVFNLRQGGLAIYGAVIAAFLTLFVYSRLKKISPYQIGDCGVYGLFWGRLSADGETFLTERCLAVIRTPFLPCGFRRCSAVVGYRTVAH